VALKPVAFEFEPTAVALPPVAAVAAQVPVKPVFVEEHCAQADEAPNTVASPAATASTRTAPPASALAPRSRARRLVGIPTDLSATASAWTRGPRWLASTVLVRTSSSPPFVAA
jgi:hypothetical protein